MMGRAFNSALHDAMAAGTGIGLGHSVIGEPVPWVYWIGVGCFFVLVVALHVGLAHLEAKS